MSGRNIRRIFFVTVVLFSSFEVSKEIAARKQYLLVTTWPRTNATILSAETLVTNVAWSYKKNNFCASLSYSYSVADRTHVGRNQIFGLPCWPEGTSFIRSHPAGTDIQIAYDPANPAISTVPGSITNPGGPWLSLLTGIFFLVCLCVDIFFGSLLVKSS